MHTLEQRLAKLEAQVADILTGSVATSTPAGPTVLVAPIQIVTAAGQFLATLEQRVYDLSLRLFNHQVIAVAALGIDSTEAGYVAIRNAEGDARSSAGSRHGRRMTAPDKPHQPWWCLPLWGRQWR